MNKTSFWGKTPPQYFGLLAAFILFFSACRAGSGCPTKGMTNNMEKTTKHGKSQLFDKGMRRKMKN